VVVKKTVKRIVKRKKKQAIDPQPVVTESSESRPFPSTVPLVPVKSARAEDVTSSSSTTANVNNTTSNPSGIAFPLTPNTLNYASGAAAVATISTGEFQSLPLVTARNDDNDDADMSSLLEDRSQSNTNRLRSTTAVTAASTPTNPYNTIHQMKERVSDIASNLAALDLKNIDGNNMTTSLDLMDTNSMMFDSLFNVEFSSHGTSEKVHDINKVSDVIFSHSHTHSPTFSLFPSLNASNAPNHVVSLQVLKNVQGNIDALSESLGSIASPLPSNLQLGGTFGCRSSSML
jgi:hypothetical protein